MKRRCLSSYLQTIDKYYVMKNLELIAEELFNKIRGRFPSITIGDEEGKVTDQPKTARFFDCFLLYYFCSFHLLYSKFLLNY